MSIETGGAAMITKKINESNTQEKVGQHWLVAWEEIKRERDGHLWPLGDSFQYREFFRLGWMACIVWAPEEPVEPTKDMVKELEGPRPEYNAQGCIIDCSEKGGFGKSWEPCKKCRGFLFKWWKFCPDCATEKQPKETINHEH